MFNLLFLMLTACGEKNSSDTGASDTGDGVDCTAQFVYSLALTIEDQDGQPVDNANITYTVDGEAGTYVEYFANGEYFVGGEEAGDFEVDIYVELPAGEDCFDIGDANLSVTVEADECHVITQAITPELDWERVCLD